MWAINHVHGRPSTKSAGDAHHGGRRGPGLDYKPFGVGGDGGSKEGCGRPGLGRGEHGGARGAGPLSGGARNQRLSSARSLEGYAPRQVLVPPLVLVLVPPLVPSSRVPAPVLVCSLVCSLVCMHVCICLLQAYVYYKHACVMHVCEQENEGQRRHHVLTRSCCSHSPATLLSHSPVADTLLSGCILGVGGGVGGGVVCWTALRQSSSFAMSVSQTRASTSSLASSPRRASASCICLLRVTLNAKSRWPRLRSHASHPPQPWPKTKLKVYVNVNV
jgi:hypothetical protein